MSWEPPVPAQLLVSARRVAQELDVPIWKANEICWCLERVFYGEGQIKYRVTRASLDAYRDLVDQGLEHLHARAVLSFYRHRRGTLPPKEGVDMAEAYRIYQGYWRNL